MELSEIGVSPKKQEQFVNKGIFTVEDLIEFFPRKYRDYRKVSKLSDLTPDTKYAVLYGCVEEKRNSSSNRKIKIATVRDEEGHIFRASWFYNAYEYKNLTIGVKYYFAGRVSVKDKAVFITPEFVTYYKEKLGVKPVYSKINGMSDDYLFGKISEALKFVENFGGEQDAFAKKLNLISRKEAIAGRHFPIDDKSFKESAKRIAYDELYTFYSNLKAKNTKGKKGAFTLRESSITDKKIISLPFELTEGQTEALKEIKETLKKGDILNALLQGDVGSGKSIVSAISLMYAAENGVQGALLAPTQILANQNYEVVKDFFKNSGFKVAFLSGSTKAKDKNKILNELKTGEINIIVGTHTIISKNVEFKNLGLAVIDEEHKFGVECKEAFSKFSGKGISVISMSATPIPRSVALALYGDTTKILRIETTPKGRLPIITKSTSIFEKTFARIREQIKLGHQVYVVCPLINDSEADSMAEVTSVSEMVLMLKKAFKAEGYKIASIDGSMSNEEAEKIIKACSENEIQILVATTIVEVGVNVPNATVMIIKNAERFGLAQLHQLRGRVGRGSIQSYCYLISKDEDIERLDILCQSNNGFEIAEQDMALRGAGVLTGVKQSGYSKEVELIIKRPKMAEVVKKHVWIQGI